VRCWLCFRQCFVETGAGGIRLKLMATRCTSVTLSMWGRGQGLKLLMNDGPVIAIASNVVERYRLSDRRRRAGEANLSRARVLLSRCGVHNQGPAAFRGRYGNRRGGGASTDWCIEALPGLTQVGVSRPHVSP